MHLEKGKMREEAEACENEEKVDLERGKKGVGERRSWFYA